MVSLGLRAAGCLGHDSSSPAEKTWPRESACRAASLRRVRIPEPSDTGRDEEGIVVVESGRVLVGGGTQVFVRCRAPDRSRQGTGTFQRRAGRSWRRGRTHSAGHPKRSVRVCGCGGAGSAIAFALAAGGVASLTLSNRTARVADDLAVRIARRYPDLDLYRSGRRSPRDVMSRSTPPASECRPPTISPSTWRAPTSARSLTSSPARTARRCYNEPTPGALPTIDGIAMLRARRAFDCAVQDVSV